MEITKKTSAEQLMDTLRENGKANYLETDKGDVVYFQANGNRLEWGGACNAGLMVRGSMEYDDCFSDDENLQAMVELINEEA